MKINSLTDKDIIKKLIQASQAGVTVELIVRGICCLKPKIPGETDHITVISVVGRFWTLPDLPLRPGDQEKSISPQRTS